MEYIVTTNGKEFRVEAKTDKGWRPVTESKSLGPRPDDVIEDEIRFKSKAAAQAWINAHEPEVWKRC